MDPRITKGRPGRLPGALAKVLTMCSFLKPALANNDLTRPLVPMSEYPLNYRTLNCWECFEAQGRMCHHDGYDHSEVFNLLQSGNKGDGFCCKNGVESGVCVQGYNDLHCSMPSYHDLESEGPNEQHSNVFSANNRNYQMFAFCPGITPAKCGIPAE